MLRKQTDMARGLLATWGGVPKPIFEGTREIFVEVHCLNECHPKVLTLACEYSQRVKKIQTAKEHKDDLRKTTKM